MNIQGFLECLYLLISWLKRLAQNQAIYLYAEENVKGKVAVITGSSSGIGAEMAAQLAHRGAIVVMACRDLVKAKVVISEILQKVPGARLIPVHLDLSDPESVTACALEIKEKVEQIDILINNAGHLSPSNHLQRNREGHELHLATNYLGHFLFTHLLLDQIKNSDYARIVNVGSFMMFTHEFRLDDMNLMNYRGDPLMDNIPYSNSKLCVALFSTELAKRVKHFDISVYGVCPGTVRTSLSRNYSWVHHLFQKIAVPFGWKTAFQGARQVLYCALAIRCRNETGKMYQDNKPWKRANQFLEKLQKTGEDLFDKSTLIFADKM